MKSDLINKLEIRKVGLEHLEQYDNLLRYAFQVTDEELLKVGWEDDEIRLAKVPILEAADVLGWFEGENLVSQISVYPMQMNIQGTIYDVGYITGVSTYPEYSGVGLMSKLMQKSLANMRARGQSLSLLYPYSIPFYRHKGWDLISDKMTFHIRDVQLPTKISAPGRVRRLEEEENEPDLYALHDRFARLTHGCLIRNKLAWDEYWRWEVDDITVAVYYSESNEPLGYMVYLLKNDIMRIKEMVCLNNEAWNGLWEFITAHESMIDAVNGNNFSNNSIAYWLEDSDIRESIQPYMMARIVDFEQFIQKYNFLQVGRPAHLTFNISDPLLEWNNRTFNVKVAPGEKPRLSNSASDNVLALSIGTLTTMLMGYKTPAYLHRIERLKTDKTTLAVLDAIIPKEKAYISDYI